VALVGELLGGMSLFIYGMKQMSEALRSVAGDRLKEILAAVSYNHWVGLVTGIMVTTVLQSSTMVSVMLVQFVSSGLMTFYQTIGILLGAGIGTTTTSQMVAFNITKYALHIIAFGFAMNAFASEKSTRQYGTVVLGLGILLFGLETMGGSIVPLRTYKPFVNALATLGNPFLGILASVVFTLIVQSSTAAIGVVLVLASQNLITLKAGVCLVLGSNIGPCLTAIVAAYHSTREAERVALANLLFKVVGVIITLPLLSPFMNLLTSITPGSLPRQIANAHTLFNIFIACIFLPFSRQISSLLTKLWPDGNTEKKNGSPTHARRAQQRHSEMII